MSNGLKRVPVVMFRFDNEEHHYYSAYRYLECRDVAEAEYVKSEFDKRDIESYVTEMVSEIVTPKELHVCRFNQDMEGTCMVCGKKEPR
jgi:hypothetical protein